MLDDNRCTIRENIRFKLSRKKVEDQFLKWLSEQKSMSTIKELMRQVKNGQLVDMKENTPAPLFNPRVQLQSNLAKSNSNMSPPRSPQMSKNHSFTDDKEPGTSTIKKITQSHLKNTLLHSIQINNNNPNPTIPQFYFPKGKDIDE